MKKLFSTMFVITWFLVVPCINVYSQIGINSKNSQPDNSSMLDVKSTSKGMLVPRMNIAQRDAISNPAKGLLIFCTDNNQYYYNRGIPSLPMWIMLYTQWMTVGQDIYYNAGNVGIGEPAPAFPLNFPSTTGDKISLYGTGTNHYGFGIQGGQLQIHSDYSFSDITFGYGSSTAFNEKMRIKGNGQVGIGTSAPASPAILDLTVYDKGLLVPRMTRLQRDEILSPGQGLEIFNTTAGVINVFNGTYWTDMGGSPADIWRCGQKFTDSRDGKQYNTVVIGGNNCWMAQNLNVGTRINSSGDQTNNNIPEKYCYNDEETNCDIYGGLYQWDELMQYVLTAGVQGLCPSGWHIPTQSEWCTMAHSLDNTIDCSIDPWTGTDGGGKMKETGSSHWEIPNVGATNTTGLTVLAGGLAYGPVPFYYFKLNHSGYLWTSSEYNYYWSWIKVFDHAFGGIGNDYANKYDGFSCRCILN